MAALKATSTSSFVKNVWWKTLETILVVVNIVTLNLSSLNEGLESLDDVDVIAQEYITEYVKQQATIDEDV